MYFKQNLVRLELLDTQIGACFDWTLKIGLLDQFQVFINVLAGPPQEHSSPKTMYNFSLYCGREKGLTIDTTNEYDRNSEQGKLI